MKRALAVIALVLAASCAEAQSVDSVWGFRQVRTFTDAHSTPIAATLGMAIITLQGANNGYFYGNRHGGGVLHGIQDWQTWGVGALGYVAGLDPLQAAGMTYLANFGFSAAMRYKMGRGLVIIDLAEPCYYESAGSPSRRKLFCRETRYAQIAIGAGLLLYKPIWRLIR